MAKKELVPFEKVLSEQLYSVPSLKKLAKQSKDIGFREWIDSEDGYEALKSYRRYLDYYLDSACTTIIDKCISHLEDRIANGDDVFVHGKPGEGGQWVKRPLSAYTLSRVFSSIFDRRRLLREKPTHIPEIITQEDDAPSLEGEVAPSQVVDGVKVKMEEGRLTHLAATLRAFKMVSVTVVEEIKVTNDL